MRDRIRGAAHRRLPHFAIRWRQKRMGYQVDDTLPAFDRLSNERFVETAYWMILLRAPDPVGRSDKLRRLQEGMSRRELLRDLAESPEFAAIASVDPLASLHRSRMTFVRSFPRARHILDLGGVSLATADGALVQLGYPYRFDGLTIIDLPPGDRHELYQGDRVDEVVGTRLGPVHYRYHSMSDLAGIADESIDLAYSGQTFEHVSRADGERVLSEVVRVLRPGGHLALDTPNRAVTEVQLRDEPNEFIDPDHEVEYTHCEMLELFERHGLELQRAHGLNLCAVAIDQGDFTLDELAAHSGLYDDIERCYLLAYVVTKELRP